jgi:hypothetical protein
MHDGVSMCMPRQIIDLVEHQLCGGQLARVYDDENGGHAQAILDAFKAPEPPAINFLTDQCLCWWEWSIRLACISLQRRFGHLGSRCGGTDLGGSRSLASETVTNT